jgi:hypothetical protein
VTFSVLQTVPFADRCFLCEFLYWVALRRFPFAMADPYDKYDDFRFSQECDLDTSSFVEAVSLLQNANTLDCLPPRCAGSKNKARERSKEFSKLVSITCCSCRQAVAGRAIGRRRRVTTYVLSARHGLPDAKRLFSAIAVGIGSDPDLRSP